MADLVAPIIPSGQDSKGPELFLQGMGTGLAAMARFAEMKRRSESDLLELAAKERIANEEHEIQKEKLSNDATLMDLHGQYYKAMGDAATLKAQHYVDSTNQVVAFNQKQQNFINEVQDHANQLSLNDPDFQAKQPVQYAANLLKFKDEWGFSQIPTVKQSIQQFQRIADQTKIPLKIGATFDPEKEKWEGGSQQQVPIWQIVKNLADPATQEETANALEASGHVKMIEDFETINGVKVPRRSTELSPEIKSAVEEGKNVKFKRYPSKVPDEMIQPAYKKGAVPMPDPDIPADDPQASAKPAFNQTDTDKLIEQAKAAVAKGAPAEQVAQRLQEMGIDPAEALAA